MNATMQATPQRRLREMLMGAVLTQALQVAAELRIADALAAGGKDAQTLACELAVEAEGIARLLRTLAAYGVFEEHDDGRFVNSAMSELLRGDAHASLRGLAVAYGDAPIWRAWEGLLPAIRSGGSAFQHTHQVSLFDYLAAHAESARRFDAAMASSASIVNDALVDAYAWSRHRLLLDVGGGSGRTLISILGRAKRVRGIVFDLPHAAERAASAIDEAGFARRCRAIAGSFFDAITPGADACLLKHILHDWDDASCVRILKNCRAALPKRGKLLVCERLTGSDAQHRYAALTDLVMLALTRNGRERTQVEYEALLRDAGFALARVWPVDGELSLMEADKLVR